MWIFLLLFCLIDAAANDSDRGGGWAAHVRVHFGPLYLNIFMLALLLCLIVSCLPNRFLQQVPRHRIYVPIIILFFTGLCLGVFGTIMNSPGLLLDRTVGITIRDYLTIPLSI